MAIGSPTGASSKSPIGAMPRCVIKPLTTRLVDVLIKVTELERIDEKAIGRSSCDGDSDERRANPMAIGKKKAVAAVLLMNADNRQVEIISVAGIQPG